MSSNLVAWWIGRRPYLLSILRLVSAFLFLQFGTAKLFALPGPIMPDGSTAAVGSLPWVAGALEVAGGLLLLLGLGGALRVRVALRLRGGAGTLGARPGNRVPRA